MAYSVEIIYSKNTDYSEPQTVTETGLPTSIDIENLDVETTYYVKAVLKNDGVIEDEDNDKFTTLSAGTIALTHQSSAREGDNYVVVYTYTSTYALSSSILRCGETIASQGVIAGNTITYTVSGLTAGVEYTCEITTIDIYTGTNVYTGTLTMPIANKIDIISTSPSETEVEVELEYTVDGGFGSGWVDYWLDVDDPSTDQPQGHETFRNGDDTCTVTGLTAGTTYLFKATILLDDGTTEISSSVVTVTTSSNYFASQYFTISNESDIFDAKISMQAESNSATTYVYYSRDNGNTWEKMLPSERGVELTTLGVGESVIVKHTGAMAQYYNGSYYAIWFRCTTDISISGNIASLCFGDDFEGIKTMPKYAYYKIFENCNSLINAENLYFGSTPVVADYGLNNTFNDCRYLTKLPDLSVLTSVGNYGMTSAFYHCDSIVSGADLRNIKSVGDSGMEDLYNYCLDMSTAYAPSVTTWTNSKMNNWLYAVNATGVVYKPANLTIPTNNVSGVPSGWTTQNY